MSDESRRMPLAERVPDELADSIAAGLLVGAVRHCASIQMDSTDRSIRLVGVESFADVVLAIEHCRRAWGGDGPDQSRV